VSTGTPTPTAPSTVTPTATGPTRTPTTPRLDYIFAQGITNLWSCASQEATDLGLTTLSLGWANLVNDNPSDRQSHYLAVFVAPGLNQADYTGLAQLSQAGGFIEQFVSLGGVAVINVARDVSVTSNAVIPNLAPGMVGFSPGPLSESEVIADAVHPYFSGEGFGGAPLISDAFNSWQPSSDGSLTPVPSGATVLLTDVLARPTLIEYPYGAGRVIMSTLSFAIGECTPGQTTLDGDPLDNLLKYAIFYSGTAQTPAPTVTPTGTPTVTPTNLTPSRTRTPTRTPLVTPSTPTATPSATATDTDTPTPVGTETPTVSSATDCVGDCNRDGMVTVTELITLVNIALGNADVSACPAGDANGDRMITVAEIVAAVVDALNGCPQS
jgi:hypothetical protein